MDYRQQRKDVINLGVLMYLLLEPHIQEDYRMSIADRVEWAERNVKQGFYIHLNGAHFRSLSYVVFEWVQLQLLGQHYIMAKMYQRKRGVVCFFQFEMTVTTALQAANGMLAWG